MKTQRLSLLPYQPSDATLLFRFMSDAQAMQHTYVAASLEQCAARLSDYEAQRSTRGFAPWVVRISDSGELIGWGGLSVDPAAPQWGLEVSYAFTPSAWARGYATELVRSSLEHAFGTLAAPEVHAFARSENLGSVRVLKKCGFTLLRYEVSLERNHYLALAPQAALPQQAA